VTFESIEDAGVDAFLAQLRDELVTFRYRPLRNRRHAIPKDGGTKVRMLSIPAVRDRVVQGALKLILEPIFEADFQPGSFGYRPKRTAHAAVNRVADAIVRYKTRVIDCDLRAYFGAPGQAGRFQRVQIPPRQGERAAPPGIEPWAHGGNDMG
jgi:RNA-directed DNA polymerase